MKHAPSWLTNTAEVCGVAVLVVLSLPVIAVLLVLFRAALLVVLIGGTVTCLLIYGLVPRVRHWVNHCAAVAEWRNAVAAHAARRGRG